MQESCKVGIGYSELGKCVTSDDFLVNDYYGLNMTKTVTILNYNSHNI